MQAATDFLVRRDDIRACRFVAAPAAEDAALPGGTVLVRVDRFAFTANNVTYAVFGERMSYWEFFPAQDGWGRVPVWGFGTVVRSACDDVAEGERYYGFYPMSSYVALRPARVGPAGFLDAAPHRAALHPLYNHYARVASADPHDDALRMLLRPLFVTSFALDDFVADDGAFSGAHRVVLSSASSKTAYGLAFLLHERRIGGAPIEVVGLTSPRNVAFAEALGVYDRVATYDAIGTLPRDGGTAYVDFGGDMAVRRAVHQRFGDALLRSIAVGFTHWEGEAPRGEPDLPGAKPAFFFAPERIKQRSREWGPGVFETRLDAAWSALTAALRGRDDWLHVREGRGEADVERVYRDTVDGNVPPDDGNVLSLT